MNKYRNTLGRLRRRWKEYAGQLLAIKTMTEALESDDVKFEVHFQCYSPSQSPAAGRGKTLGEAYTNAEANWKALNGNSREPTPPAAEAFARVGTKLVLIDKKDALAITRAEGDRGFFDGTSFGGDVRLTQEVGKNVWNVKDELPGWHAKAT